MNRDEDPWRSEAAIAGLATPVRHRNVNIKSKSRFHDSPNERGTASWRDLASPHRRRSAERTGSGQRLSPQWSSGDSLKDARSQPCIASQSWDSSSLFEAPASEPFIPPPPLLDFETANLLPPVGVDVSSPSDEHNFLSLSHETQIPQEDKSWTKIPPQYATLRRPRSSSEVTSCESYASLRRPKTLNNSMISKQDADLNSIHNTAASTRKCTCGQKMRLTSYGSDGQGLVTSDELSTIATIRRPIKRKERAVSTSETQSQPKLETSVLLDKLLRAGALRPEDYLVLSRMEKMIMANHCNQKAKPKAPHTPSKAPSSSVIAMADPSRDTRRDTDISCKPAARSKPNPSSELLFDSLQRSTIVQSATPQDLNPTFSRTPAKKEMDRALGQDYYGVAYSNQSTAVAHSNASNEMFQFQKSGTLSNSYSRSEVYSASNTQGYVTRCPCCGSQSHYGVHHVCTLCGGAPHFSAKLAASTAVPNYTFQACRSYGTTGPDFASLNKFTPAATSTATIQQQPPAPVIINRAREIPTALSDHPPRQQIAAAASPTQVLQQQQQQQQMQQRQQQVQRTVSAPTQQSRISQVQTNMSEGQINHTRASLVRTLSRPEAVKDYLKKSTAAFFGVDESKETDLRRRWDDRRKRLVSRRCGLLKEAWDNMDGGMDTPDGSRRSESVNSTLAFGSPSKTRESVAKMTWDGLSYLISAVVRLRQPFIFNDEEALRSRSVLLHPAAAPQPPSQLALPSSMPPDVTMTSGGASSTAAESVEDEIFFDCPPPRYDEVPESGPTPPAMPAPQRRAAAPADNRGRRWKRDANLHRAGTNATSLVDRLKENSNRRQYGMGVVGRLTRRSLRRSVMENDKDIKEQLGSFEDHRPYFTYWACTAQIFIMAVALITYGFGPVGVNLHRRSGLVLVTSLSLQQVDYFEPANFWIGPRAADLIHLGAKFSPCMRPDARIREEIEASRMKERQTACCIRNDNSGCVQTSRAECSSLSSTPPYHNMERGLGTDVTSTWKKWNVVQSGPGGRISGSVCGQDPNFCIEPASVAPFEWPDDITKWPKCRKKLPGLSSESKSVNVVLKTTTQAEHMVCEVIGHPCCIGIHGECRIATREYCDFVKGYFHEEASLCSQVSCMNDVCGMLPFQSPDVPDQFYRIWTSLFLHAGILHLAISITFQMIIMRDLEKLVGPARIAIIYLGSGVIGNLASALFVPYRAEVGPSGSHFGLLACLCVEVLHAWPLLRHPCKALSRLLGLVAVLFIVGLLPWVDNFAHIFGFLSGGMLSYALLPFITVGTYDRRRKLLLISVSLSLTALLTTTLVLFLYVWPIQDMEVIQLLGYLTCIPLTGDFCAEQNIHFNKRDVLIS